jgi:hypothetical protein
MRRLIRSVLIYTTLGAAAMVLGLAQQSPPAQTSVTIGGKTISIKYAAPSVRGRKIFGDGGLLSHDPHYPVWRAGANAATALHTDADLDLGNLHVPAGDYTLFVDVSNPDQWTLIVSKKTGEWGLAYDDTADLGRVKMQMTKPSAPVEKFQIVLSSAGPASGRLQMQWENHIASVDFHAR